MSNNMNTPPRRRPNQRRPNRSRDQKPVNIWRAVPAPPEVESIAVLDDPSALVRSLGDLPLPGKGDLAGHYVAAVIERAAALASALAASVDLLDTPDPGSRA